MSKRCKLQSRFYKEFGYSCKDREKNYSTRYVKWLEDQIINPEEVEEIKIHPKDPSRTLLKRTLI